MKPTIIQLLSASFSGSSLLNLLLDSQPDIAGLGEVAQVWEEKPPGASRGPCHICGTTAGDCSFWRGADAKRPYHHAAERLGASHYVDSSKSHRRMLRTPESLEGFETRELVVVKAPHEWIHATWEHSRLSSATGKQMTPDEGLVHWVNLYRPKTTPLRDRLIVGYEALANRPEQVMAQIMGWLGLPFDARPIRDGSCFTPRSHALGGNPAVIAQARNTPDFMHGEIDSRRYMGGKYNEDRFRRVRYDDAWTMDREFLAAMLDAYAAWPDGLPDVMSASGCGSINDAVGLLRKCHIQAINFDIDGTSYPVHNFYEI